MSGQSANDEERRRKQEMSMFAAYATGGGGDDTNGGGGDKGGAFDGSSLRFDKPPAVAAANKSKEPQRSANDNSFLAAARAGAAGTFQDSGSFAFQSPTATTSATTTASNDTHRSSSRVSVAERSNLSAALAALTKDDPSANSATTSKSSSAIKLPAVGGTAPTHFRSSGGGGTDANHNNSAAEEAAALEDKIPMFAEEVVMPRPLFFGAIVPPRVLQAAREMVQTAVQEQKALAGSNGGAAGAVLPDKPPRLHELPPAVRNIVGALRTYGFGLDELLSKPPPVDRRFSNHSSTSSSKRASFEEPEDWWRGSGHVTTYQPVWGSDVRAARVQKYLAHHAAVKKPSIVSRVSTAPPRMVGESSDEEEDDDDYGDDDDSFVAAPPVAAIPEHDIVFVDKGGGGGEKPPVVNANDQFSSWIRQDSDSLPGNASAESVSSMRSGDSLVGGAVEESAPAELSEQEKFSQWALGSTGDLNGTTIVAESPVFHTGNGSDTFQFSSPFNPSTFQRMRTSSNVDSDDGSIFDDEQKKQVGVNESLSKAVALLAEDDGPAQANVDPAAEQSQILLSQVPQDGKRKRPLTNYELTSGCVPLFGVDDSPLPQEADLGILETKEEVQRATEQKRSQEIIEKFVPRNVFGPIVCPNPATNPDDYHSWNSRTTSSSNPMNMGRVTSASSVASDPVGLRRQHFNTAGSDPMGVGMGRVNSNKSPQKPPKIPRQGRDVSGLPSNPPLQGSRQRFGWWSQSPKTPENEKQQSLAKDGIPEELEAENDAISSTQDLQFPPSHHSASAVQFVTPLEPNPEELREDNLPLSRMHAATSMVQSLPYLSDRPPSFRYLQIDTQAIAFPPIKTEIEPLFCSLALYNVETVSSGMSTTGAKNSAPIPDLQRCGRVTEALYFDHVVDPEVEGRCEGALWPYAKSNPTARDMSSDRQPRESERLRGTRCGVFPIPSNLNVSNLYAVLIVQKVVSENADLDPYLKPGKPISDLEKLKSNAAKNSARHGSFVVPFAFGVAPLLQVFGTDNPVTASSRAVQIPLFHFSDGERQIIDHIMVMLFPR